jgi:hypothetical protein
MNKSAKTYVFTSTKPYTGRSYTTEPLTLQEAIEYFSYTLECGASYSGHKINKTPKTINSLVNNLNKASENKAANGIGDTYTAVEFTGEQQ